MKGSPLHEYIVITQHATISDIQFHWDGQRWTNLSSAIDHGFTLERSDDFNIGLIHGDVLLWFGWMDRPVRQDIAKVADAIGLRAKTKRLAS